MKIPKLKTNPAAGLLADALEHEDIKPARAARDMGIPRSRLSDIFAGRKGVSADTALRLGKWFGTGPRLWLNLQQAYELDLASQTLKGTLKKIKTRKAA